MKACLLCACVFLLVGSIYAECPNVQAVDLDVAKYLGGWYELATTEDSRETFERNCTCTHADYTLMADKEVQVNNTCRKGAPSSPLTEAIGKARIPDPSQPGKLEVTFGSPFWAPYWIVFIDDTYSNAVVWSCTSALGINIEWMWILSRTQTVSTSTYQMLTSKAQQITGYDVSKLKMTTQQGCPAL
eukprot:TRINITY_DN305_c0_g1_i2.p1 TRINITY_DN305_c0_g1~~TRINITY_DN305_c0_g1_i2.p1  ORF type:complete len:206 (-),score=36.31 TRINITY_DN305_c0_g1_i2:102-662(-)